MLENQDDNRNEEPFARQTQPIEGPPPTAAARPRANTSLPWIIGGLLALVLILSIVAIQFAYNKSKTRGAELPPLPVSNAEMASPAELSNSFRAIARAVKPAVVHINVTETAEGSSPGFDLPFELPQGPRRSRGSGSGFLVRDDGYILTNNHVVQNAEKIDVTTSDSKTFKATLVGTDPESDLAVIKIDETGLPFAVLGDSDAVEQGDWVLALGSPFGLQQTLTAGIVSATGRELTGQGIGQYSKFIQTDASINPGNSGGPLVNMRGEVVGINTLIFTRSGGAEGIGFAISSNTARQVYEQLVKSGKVVRGYLGVSVIDLDDPRARAFGVEANSGALIADVPSGDTPAVKAGLKSGDVITAFDGKPVRSSRQLTDAVAATPVGKTVRVDFIRQGQPQSITVEVAQRPENVNARNNEPTPPPRPDVEQKATSLGVSVQPVTPEIADRMNLREPTGALVRSVTPGSPASEAGLRHGDVIHRVGNKEIKVLEDLTEAVKSLSKGEEVAIQIERGGRMTFVTVTIE
ncbi:MAG TPA: DegQ family serine endoprotease [Blastocatellia bacterium]|nr:DegQ family serine endoprotease [Blastocatellia bacterium]